MNRETKTAHIFTVWSKLKERNLVKDSDTEYGTGWDNDADLMYQFMLKNFSNDRDVINLIELFKRYKV